MKSFDFQAFKNAVEASIMLDLEKTNAIPECKMPRADLVLKNIYDRQNENKKTPKRLVGKRLIAAIIAAVLIVACSITAIAFKDKLLDFFEIKDDTNTSLISPGNEDSNEEIKEVFLPTYVPEAFHLKSHSSSSMSVVTLWSDNKNYMQLKQMPIKSTHLRIDTENNDYIEAVFGNQPVYYVVKHDAFSAVWHTENYVYSFDAPWYIGIEEIEKIVSSISFDREL